MLLERIKNLKYSLPEIIDKLKQNNINIDVFFTKTPIKFQFIIINHILIFNYSIGITITPNSYKVYNYNKFDNFIPIELLINKPINLPIDDILYENALFDTLEYINNNPF